MASADASARGIPSGLINLACDADSVGRARPGGRPATSRPPSRRASPRSSASASATSPTGSCIEANRGASCLQGWTASIGRTYQCPPGRRPPASTPADSVVDGPECARSPQLGLNHLSGPVSSSGSCGDESGLSGRVPTIGRITSTGNLRKCAPNSRWTARGSLGCPGADRIPFRPTPGGRRGRW